MRRLPCALPLVATSATAASARYRPRSNQHPDDASVLPPRPARIMDAMRETNALARRRAMAVPSPAPQQRAAELESDARKQMDEERARRGREEGEGKGERRRGGGMGRPPEG